MKQHQTTHIQTSSSNHSLYSHFTTRRGREQVLAECQWRAWRSSAAIFHRATVQHVKVSVCRNHRTLLRRTQARSYGGLMFWRLESSQVSIMSPAEHVLQHMFWRARVFSSKHPRSYVVICVYGGLMFTRAHVLENMFWRALFSAACICQEVNGSAFGNALTS